MSDVHVGHVAIVTWHHGQGGMEVKKAGWAQRIELPPYANTRFIWVSVHGDGVCYLDEMLKVQPGITAVYASPLGVVFE